MHLTTEIIASAINDDEWQKFRLSLRGQSTEAKLKELSRYLDWGLNIGGGEHTNRCIRVQNYLNALSRGGQIAPCDLDIAVFLQVKEAKILR